VARLSSSSFWLTPIALLLLVACKGWAMMPSRVPSPSPAPPAGILDSPTMTALASSPVAATPVAPVSSATFFVVNMPTEYVALYHLAAQERGAERLIRRVLIPILNVDAAVVPVGWRRAPEGNAEWDSPGPYVGWVVTSALPDEAGNVILYGHNNLDGQVFRDLYRLQAGDEIVLVTERQTWRYQVKEVVILDVQEAEANRRAYETYLRAAGVARLTVISCYPPQGNRYRVVVVAQPAPGSQNP